MKEGLLRRGCRAALVPSSIGGLRISLLCIAALVFSRPTVCKAETISSALAEAYAQNPDLGQERAATRASDEAVARAKAGYRPTLEGHAAGGFEDSDAENGSALDRRSGPASPASADLIARQTIFDGSRTTSRAGAADSRMLEARERLRQKEQDILLASATAYMDVMRDTALLDLRHQRIVVLILRLREARARLRVGEDTPSDVALTASYLATAHSAFFIAQGLLMSSIGTYRRLIGHVPVRLEPARPLDPLVPPTQSRAERQAAADHPRVQAALHRVDALIADEHEAESALYPQLSAEGKIRQSDQENGNPDRNLFSSSVSTQLDMDFYKGGETAASIREAKEKITQARLEADAARDAILTTVEEIWGLSQSTKELVQSAQAAVKASETAYFEVRQEAKVGQRTMLDELKADEALEQARETLVSAQHDRVLDTYRLIAAVGGLSKDRLGLAGSTYDPELASRLVTDKWIGLRTPDGR